MSSACHGTCTNSLKRDALILWLIVLNSSTLLDEFVELVENYLIVKPEPKYRYQ